MAEVIDEVIDDVTDVTDANDTPDVEDEQTLALKHFWIDPDNIDSADTNDLLKIALRGYRAEQVKIQEKREKKTTKNQELPTNSDLETRLFFIENQDAKQYKDEFVKVREQYPALSFEDALELAKSKTPKESTTKKEWFQWGWYKAKPKALEELSEEEAVDTLSPEKYAVYLKKTGKIL